MRRSIRFFRLRGNAGQRWRWTWAHVFDAITPVLTLGFFGTSFVLDHTANESVRRIRRLKLEEKERAKLGENRIYKPVTILTEDKHGRIGSEAHDCLTQAQIISRCKWLSQQGWEPQEIQVDESQYTLPLKWWD